MTKTQMRNADRDAIRAAVIQHKFAPIEAALLAEEVALAVEARQRAYGAYLKTIEAAPRGAFAEDSAVKVNVGGPALRLRFGDEPRVYKRVFYEHHYSSILAVPADDEYAARVMAWADRSEQTKEDRSKLRAITDGTLAAFRSFDDLLIAWPEAEPFIKARWQTRPEYSANVPAVQLADLSRQLDLPPDLAEAA